MVAKYEVTALLVSALEVENHRLGVDEFFQLHTLLNLLPENIETTRMKTMLTPLLSRDLFTQTIIYKAFDTIIESFNARLIEDEPLPVREPEIIEKPIKEENQPINQPESIPIEAIQEEKPKVVLELKSGNKPPYFWEFKFEIIPELEISPQIELLTSLMRQRSFNEVKKLDITKTVKLASRQNGRIEFVYSKKTQPNEYLFLIDLPHPQALRPRLFDALVKFWQKEEVFIEKFFFKGDIKLCWNDEYRRGITLTDLQQKYPHHQLFILGDGSQLLSPISGELARWSSLFEQWRLRAIVTPHSTDLWDSQEERLAERFNIIPASLESLAKLTQNFNEKLEAQNQVITKNLVATELEPINFSYETEEEASIGLQILEVEYIEDENGKEDDSMLQWIAACAVYPSIDWEWTLKLGQIVGQNAFESGNSLLTIENIYKLARLDWFSNGKMTDALRTVLLKWLREKHPNVETKVRESLTQLLEENKPEQGTGAVNGFKMMMAMNQLLLKPDLETKKELETTFQELAESGFMPDDFVTLTAIDRDYTDLDIKIPEAWYERLNEKIPTNKFKIENPKKSIKNKAIRKNGLGVPKIESEYSFDGTNYFLGIGINDYEGFPKLRNAVKDVEDIANVLEKHYYFERENIQLLCDDNATRENIIEGLFDLRYKINNNDRLLIYFSGHGFKDDNRGFWIPVNAKKDRFSTYISNAEVRDIINGFKARHILLICDSCFSRSFFVRDTLSKAEQDISWLDKKTSRWAFVSGKSQISDRIESKNGPFAESIIEALFQNGEAVFDIISLADFVQKRMMYNYAQQLEVAPLNGVGHMGGSFLFFRKPKQDIEDIEWQTAIEIDKLEVYLSYLKSFPNGQYVYEAKKKISKINYKINTKHKADLIQYSVEDLRGERRNKDETLIISEFQTKNERIESLKEKFRDLIANGKTKECIKMLFENLSSDNIKLLKKINFLYDRFSKIENGYMFSIITDDYFNKEEAKINFILLNIIDEITFMQLPEQENINIEPASFKILWVDDRPDNNIRERKYFENQGFEFTLAISTNEALKILEKNKFVAIISDMGRKEGPQEGYALLEVIRKSGDQTPFVIYAGSNSEQYKKLAREKGAQGSTNNTKELFELVINSINEKGKIETENKVVAIESIKMVFIKGGTFEMGDVMNDNEFESEKPIHLVNIASFQLGIHQVTQKQWEVVMGNNPSYFKGEKLPVENVSWDDVQNFIKVLNKKTGKNYRLPREAEWEYAAREGGKTVRFGNGKAIANPLEMNFKGSKDYKSAYSIVGDYRRKTTEVGIFNSNSLGLYDMSGNVWEWCEDNWHDNYYNAPINGSAWIDSPRGSRHILRGGSWSNDARFSRSTNRGGNRTNREGNTVGFRLALSLKCD